MGVGHAPAHANPKVEPRAALEPLAKELVDGEYCGGLVVALIPAAGPPQILAWGETVRGNHKAPDGNTVFEIGSASKVFTSLLLADLVTRKQLTLETPVAKLLPPKTKLPRGKREITVLDLATHTSGLPRMPDNFHPADPNNPYADYTVDQLYSFLGTATLSHEPGTTYDYSNLGAGLLGQALARRGNAEWAALVEHQIAHPLAMTSTMFTLTDDARRRLAQGYDPDGEPASNWDLAALAGAGALRSTAVDMAAFVKAEIAATHGSSSPLAKAMALSQAPQRNLGVDASTGTIGLAWHIKPDGTIWHNGQTGGYHSFVGFRPGSQLGIVVLASGASEAIDKLGAAALATLAGDPVPATLGLPPPGPPVAEAVLETYAGTYVLKPTFSMTVSRTGAKLFVQATGQPRFRLHATSQTEFSLHAVAASVTFERDAKGKVTGLVLHQGGQDQRATRN